MGTLFPVLFWIFFAVSSLLLWPVNIVLWLVSLPFDRQGRVAHWFTSYWASLYILAYPGWRLTVTGREKIVPGRAYVLAANHSSFADIILCYRLHRQFKWVSKRSVFFAPVVGWNMFLCRYVPLVRGREDSIQRMMDSCRGWLRRGMSIMMFPEGTRSKDGRVGPFKHGAFTLAREAGVPVIPIAIHGTSQVMPKHGAAVAPKGDLRIEVLDPVPPDGFRDAAEYGEAVRRKIVAALGQE